MDLIKNLLPEDYSDRLFTIILSAVLIFYAITTYVFILNKSNYDPFGPKTKLPKRITQLIINLPKPMPKKTLIKPIPKPEKPLRKEKLAANKPVKKIKKPPRIKKKPEKSIAPRKIAVSAVEPVAKKAEKDTKPEIDLESLGMLSLVSVIDETKQAADILSLPDIASLKIDKVADFKGDVVYKSEEQPEIEEVISADDKARELTDDLEDGFDIPKGFEAMFSENELFEIEQPESTEDYANDGTRNSKIIQQIVSKYTNGMKFCYNNSLRKEETLKGTVIVKFTILGSGMTDKVSIISNEIRDQRLEHCIIGIIFRWEFPPSKIDKLVVTYPISFVKTS